jgi:YidC/Oxa1 family membrane protein insertase
MDQKRLFLAIAISVAILLGFQLLMPHPPAPPPAQTAGQTTPAKPGSAEPGAVAPAKPVVAANTVPKNVPRVQIDAPSVGGSISLLGARIDDLVLKDYRETLEPNSPLVRLLEPRSEAEPYYVQYGWTAPAGVSIALPGDDTVWSASATELAVGKPVTLSWDNGAGLTFEIALSIDENYMLRAGVLVSLVPHPARLHPGCGGVLRVV